MQFYTRKSNGRYTKVHETPRLYMDGVWLVSNNGNSACHILNLGELPELYPFAEMMMSHEKLSQWISYKGMSEIFGSLEVTKDGCRYEFRAPKDMGREILRFLCLTEKQQDDEIEELQRQTYIDYEGGVRDKTGALIHPKLSREALEANIAKKEKEIKQLKKFLNR